MKASRILFSALVILLAGHAVWLETGAPLWFGNRAQKEEAVKATQETSSAGPAVPVLKTLEKPEVSVASVESPAPEIEQVDRALVWTTQRSGGKTVTKGSYMHRVPPASGPDAGNFLGLDITKKEGKK